MNKKFHVEHNVKPDTITKILPIFTNGHSFTRTEIYRMLPIGLWPQSGEKVKINYLNKNIYVLNIFQLISKNTDQTFCITTLGRKMLDFLSHDRKLFFDIMHFLYYSTWIKDHKQTFSWTYKQICDLIWEQNSNNIDSKKILNGVYNSASSAFNNSSMSLSSYAIEGVRNWLLALDPPLIKKENGKIIKTTERDHCSPELLLLAIDLFYTKNNIGYGTPILMTNNKKEEIAKACLVNRESISNLIDLSVNMFGHILKWQSSTWGRSLILSKKVDILGLGEVK